MVPMPNYFGHQILRIATSKRLAQVRKIFKSTHRPAESDNAQKITLQGRPATRCWSAYWQTESMGKSLKNKANKYIKINKT